jgi:hypothetical protein
MIRLARIALARRAFEKANAEYMAYQSQPAGAGWRFAIADALHLHLIGAERRLSYLINS